MLLEEPMRKSKLEMSCVVDAAWMERRAWGEVVESPTFPALSTKNLVAEEEPIAKAGAVPRAEVGLMERRAHGEVEPTPREALKRPFPPRLRTPEMVVDPVTARAEVVACEMFKIPPPTALRTPPMVEDAVTESAEVVAEDAERLRSVVKPVFDMEKSVEVAKMPPVFDEDAMVKSVRLFDEEASAAREKSA